MPQGMSYRPSAQPVRSQSSSPSQGMSHRSSPSAFNYAPSAMSYSAPSPASRSSGATYATSSQASYEAPRRSNVTYATQSRAAAGLGQVEVPPIAPIADPWYQQKARELQRVAASAVMSGLGQDAPLTPPPPKAPNTGMMLGWLAVTAVAAGLFWAVTSGPMGKPVRANRKRRSSRRRSSRRVSRNADAARRDVWDPNRERAKLKEMLKQARYNVRAYQKDVERGGAGVAGWKRELVYWKAQVADIERKLNSLHGLTRNYHGTYAEAVMRRLSKPAKRKKRRVTVAGRKRATTRRRKTARRTSKSRRLAANTRKSSAYAQAQTALSTIRNLGVDGAPSAAKLSKSVQDKLARRGMGLYRVGGSGRSPKITAFASSTSLRGAMTNTRIATTASGEPHWLVKVYKGGRPKVVVVRYIGKDGKTRFRAEEYARAMFKVAQEYARGLRSRRVG